MTSLISIALFCVAFVAFVVVLALTLWVGVKVARLPGSFASMFGIALVTGLFGIVPWVGWIPALVWIGLVFCKVADADLWPHAIPIFLFSIFTTGAAQFGLVRFWHWVGVLS